MLQCKAASAVCKMSLCSSDVNVEDNDVSVTVLRQRVIVQLLHRALTEMTSLEVTCRRLVQDGVLTRDVLPELVALGLSPDFDALQSGLSGGQLERSITQTLEPAPRCAETSRFEQDFECIELLGRGAFGDVWRCRHRLDGQEYAVKRVRCRSDMDVEQHVLREARVNASISHPNIVRYHTAWVETHTDAPHRPSDFCTNVGLNTVGEGLPAYSFEVSEQSILFHELCSGRVAPSSPFAAEMRAKQHTTTREASVPRTCNAVEKVVWLYIQMELCSKDTLETWISTRNAALSNGEVTPWEHASWARASVDVFHQCASALAHLNAHGIMHRDLKPANILFGRDGLVRFADFGLAQHTGSTDGLRVGTPQYCSPEQFEARGPCSVQTDIYALGVVLAEILCPVQTRMERAALMEGLRCSQSLPEEVARTCPEAARLAIAMTSREPASRPTAQQLLQSLDVLEHELCGDEALSKPATAKRSDSVTPDKITLQCAVTEEQVVDA